MLILYDVSIVTYKNKQVRWVLLLWKRTCVCADGWQGLQTLRARLSSGMVIEPKRELDAMGHGRERVEHLVVHVGNDRMVVRGRHAVVDGNSEQLEADSLVSEERLRIDSVLRVLSVLEEVLHLEEVPGVDELLARVSGALDQPVCIPEQTPEQGGKSRLRVDVKVLRQSLRRRPGRDDVIVIL